MQRSHLLAAATYLLLALTFWLPYGPTNGMPYETAFAWTSETTPFPSTMLYYGDPLRVFTSVFYDLGYRLSEFLQIPGSYLGQQLVFLALIWARGLFLYLALAALLPKAPWLAFFSGAFLIVHASDTAYMWVGQMNQLGYMFWLALSFYALVRATVPGHAVAPRLYSALALAACYLCIYSYESPIFILGLLPLILWLADSRRVKANPLLFALWYLILANYSWRYLRRMMTSDATYQSTVARSDFPIAELAADWLRQVQASVSFWNWNAGEPDPAHNLYAIAAAVVFLLGCYFFYRLNGFDAASHYRASAAALPVALAVCFLSFSAYLFLAGGIGAWRTHFLSAFGAAATLAALLFIAAALLPNRIQAVAILAACLIVYCGVRTLSDLARSHWLNWQRQRSVIAQILATAPQLQPGAVVVLLGVPPGHDPFGHDIWFQYAIRLAYPRQPIGAIYYRDAGQPSPGLHLDLDPDTAQWKWNGQSMPPMKHSLPAGRTIFFERTPNGSIRVLPAWPEFIAAPAGVKSRYNPAALISTGPPSPLAVNRYSPIPATN